jgi:hypothetical protein
MIISMTFLLVMLGLFLFSFNSLFPSERLLGLSGRAMLLTATLLSVQLVTEIPAEFYALWRGVVIGLIGLLVSGVVEFLREYSGQRVLGNEKKIVLTYVACLSAMGFAFNDAVASMVSMFGIGFLLTYCFCSLLWMLAKGSLLRSKIGILYFVSFLITDTMFFRDFMLLPGNAAMFDGVKRMINMPPFLQEEIYFSPSALMLLLFSMMAVVIQRYQAAREYEEAEAVRIYGALAQSEAEKAQYGWDYLYEPDAKELLDGLLTRYVESQVYQGVVENIACEQAARMVAMKNATENAGELIGELKLVYNKARQAAITQELAEIVSGAAAIS